MPESMMGWLIAAAGAALMTLGKDSPVAKVLTKARDIMKKKVPIVAEVSEKPEIQPSKLPDWLNDANDLQKMLLFLASQAAKNGNVELKDATLELMKPYADLQVAVQE